MKSSLQTNPFSILKLSTRDNSHKIVEAAEERSLFLENDVCQKARLDLTNPRMRLSAEVAWMPGVAPRLTETLIETLIQNPLSSRVEANLPQLAQANLMAAACDLLSDDQTIESVAQFILDFAWMVDSIVPEDVLRDINEDRAISGFPEVPSTSIIMDELAERRKVFRSVLKNLLDRMSSNKLVGIMNNVVETATSYGSRHGPTLLEDLVDTYEIETQGFLQKEYANIAALIKSVRETAPLGQIAVIEKLKRLECVTRNWDKVAQPIQICAKSRGLVHGQSRDLAYELRSLAVDLNNQHNMPHEAHRLTEFLREIFAELPEVRERLDEDAEVIAGLLKAAEDSQRSLIEWKNSISFKAEVGVLFKDELAISSEGIHWKRKIFPLASIARVKWGGIRNSVNGIPTGTVYTIIFGDNRSDQTIKLRNETTYNGFINAMWRAVCVRLAFETLTTLSQGHSISYGQITIQDDSVILLKHNLFRANERVKLTWYDVHIWSANGNFIIGHKDDKKIYASASYLEDANTHILEHIIRSVFKKGAQRLSDYLKD